MLSYMKIILDSKRFGEVETLGPFPFFYCFLTIFHLQIKSFSFFDVFPLLKEVRIMSNKAAFIFFKIT